MGIIGIPDATLPLKRDLLDYRLTQITDAYDKYQELIVAAKDIARSAYEIQDDYAGIIISEDNTKQVIEDQTEAIENINLKIDRLVKEYGDATDGTREQATIKEEAQDLQATRNSLIEKLKQLHINMRNIKARKKNLEVENDNVKYEITVVNKLRKRCRDLQQQWYTFYREWTNVVELIATQTTLGAQATSVMNGNIFPQGTPTLLDIAGASFSGVFSGYNLTLGSPQPQYRNILLAARESAALDEFWIADSSLELSGKYLRLANGRIVKVTKQQGAKCTIDLPPKKKKKRTEKRDVVYEGPTVDPEKFSAVLNRVLTGQETDEQIQNVIASMPTSVSQYIWTKLKGPKKTFVIDIPEDVYTDLSSFKVAYGLEEVSAEISVLATETEIRTAILDNTVSIDDITVSITEVHPSGAAKQIKITQPPNTESFRIVDAKIIMPTFGYAGVPGRIEGKYDTTDAESGFRRFILKQTTKPYLKTGKIVEFTGEVYISLNGVLLSYDMSNGNLLASTIETDAVAAGAIPDPHPGITFEGELTRYVTSDSGDDPSIKITLIDDIYSLFYEAHTGLIYTLADLKNPSTKELPHLEQFFEGDLYAFEHTSRQRQKIIDDDIEQNVNAPSVTKIRSKLKDLLKKKRQQQLNGDVDSTLESAIQGAAALYSKAISNIQQGSVGLSKAYEIISDEEYKQLYEMELTGYLEWRNDFQELDQSFEEEQQYEFTALDITATIQEASSIILPEWVTWINGLDTHEKAYETELLPNSTQAFIGNVGDAVTLQGLYQEKFVCNTLPSTLISVYAYYTSMGFKQLTPVPSRYYTYNENESYGSLNCTTVTLAKPLSQIDENWEDQIYVTLQSSVGPNIADIIAWIISNYSYLAYDTVSFAHVHTLVANYPANFAVFDRVDAMQLIREIAFQSRCSLWNKLDKVYIRYLPEEPTAVNTITEENVEEKSFELSYTPSEEIITKLTARWRPNYVVDTPWQIVVRRNLIKYGEFAEDREFYIYNSYDLVWKSATWWLIMWANTFKHAKFRVFLDQLNLETFDCISLNLTNNPFANENVKGIIRKADYDSSTHSIQLDVWLPVIAGEMTTYQYAWPKDLVVTEIWPPPEDITAGNAGNPFNQYVPTGTEYDPVNDNDFNLRPKDFGKPDMSDISDTLPQSPADAFAQIDYERQDNDPVELSEDKTAEVEKDKVEFAASAVTQADAMVEAANNMGPSVVPIPGRIIGFYDSETLTDVDSFGETVSSTGTVTKIRARILLANGSVINAGLRQYEQTDNDPYPIESQVMVSYERFTQAYEVWPLTYPDPNGTKVFE